VPLLAVVDAVLELRRKHVKVISHAALLEFKHGSAERGRSIMEGVLQNCPKRLDLWSVYNDQEARQGGVDQVRGLYKWVVTPALPPEKTKLLSRSLEGGWSGSRGEGVRVEWRATECHISPVCSAHQRQV
jgi:hypothetical protein